MLSFEWASLIETVGYKLAEGKGLREGRDSKELWKSVEKANALPLLKDQGLGINATAGPYWLTLTGYQYTLPW